MLSYYPISQDRAKPYPSQTWPRASFAPGHKQGRPKAALNNRRIAEMSSIRPQSVPSSSLAPMGGFFMIHISTASPMNIMAWAWNTSQKAMALAC